MDDDLPLFRGTRMQTRAVLMLFYLRMSIILLAGTIKLLLLLLLLSSSLLSLQLLLLLVVLLLSLSLVFLLLSSSLVLLLLLSSLLFFAKVQRQNLFSLELPNWPTICFKIMIVFSLQSTKQTLNGTTDHHHSFWCLCLVQSKLEHLTGFFYFLQKQQQHCNRSSINRLQNAQMVTVSMLLKKKLDENGRH